MLISLKAGLLWRDRRRSAMWAEALLWMLQDMARPAIGWPTQEELVKMAEGVSYSGLVLRLVGLMFDRTVEDVLHLVKEGRRLRKKGLVDVKF